jgi:chemotaxis response regulator CheB
VAPRIRVLIVDDSALMRQVLSSLLARDPSIEVVGVASDPYVAREKIRQLNPDVLTLDVEMPRMDGLAFLEKLMRAHPMPVVMVSSLTEAGCATTLRALELGAVDFVTKPKLDLREQLPEVAQVVIEKIKAAAMARVRPLTAGNRVAAPPVRAAAGALQEHGPGRGRRGLHGRDGSPQGVSHGAPRRLPRGRGGAAHAREVHARLRGPPRYPVHGARQGGRGW